MFRFSEFEGRLLVGSRRIGEISLVHRSVDEV